MNNILQTSRQALNSIRAAAADISILAGGFVSIGTTGNESPRIKWSLIKTLKIRRSQVAEGERYVVTVTHVADKFHSFKIIKDSVSSEPIKSMVVEVRAKASGDDGTTVAASLTAQVRSVKDFAEVTFVASSNTITIQGEGVTVLAGENTSVANTQRTVALNSTAGTAISGTSTVTIVSAAAHNLVTGQVVKLAGATGFTFTNKDTGVSSTGEIDGVTIAVVNSTSFTLRGVTGAGTNSGTATLTVQASRATGQGEDVAKERYFKDGAAAAVLPVATNTYTEVDIEYSNSVQDLASLGRVQGGRHVVYLNESDSDIEDLIERFIEVRKGYVAGTTDFDSSLLAAGA